MTTTIYEQIGLKIRELRMKYSEGMLSQEALAARLNKFFEVSITVFFPDLRDDSGRVAALTSALGGLTDKEVDDVIGYAEFRKVRRAMQGADAKRLKPKR